MTTEQQLIIDALELILSDDDTRDNLPYEQLMAYVGLLNDLKARRKTIEVKEATA